MRNILCFGIAILSWIAVVVQYYLMLVNSTNTTLETTIRFFSFFTILTNSIIAVYFSILSFAYLMNQKHRLENPGTLTAITMYITIVGLVYQIILRSTWNPTGTQKIIDELLHSLNPLLVIIFWSLSKTGDKLSIRQVPFWLIFPSFYLIYVLIRGYFSNFYPYPFLNITHIGFERVFINCIGLTAVFIIVSLLFIWISRLKAKIA